MTRQAHTQQGRMLNPFKTVLFISALLMFVFTVVYRMVKSASFSNAVATLVESLLIVFFFIFLGILLAIPVRKNPQANPILKLSSLDRMMR
jgi:amino acid transporter